MLTISRQYGSEGDEITRLLAVELGWRLLDNPRVEQLLVEKGFPQAVVETFNERRPDLWHRLSSGKERYLHYLKLASYEFARQGECIVLGRGGQLMFAGVPGVLKIRITAPLEDRVRRLGEEAGKNLHKALLLAQHSDNERAGFHRFLFHADWDSPYLYDLVLNTHQLSPRGAADLILRTLASGDLTARREEARGKVEQLHLVQKAYVSILFEQRLPVHYLEIEAHDGTITLRGVARDNPSIERCADTAAEVFGSKRIDNQVSFEPRYVEVLGGLHRVAGL